MRHFHTHFHFLCMLCCAGGILLVHLQDLASLRLKEIGAKEQEHLEVLRKLRAAEAALGQEQHIQGTRTYQALADQLADSRREADRLRAAVEAHLVCAGFQNVPSHRLRAVAQDLLACARFLGSWSPSLAFGRSEPQTACRDVTLPRGTKVRASRSLSSSSGALSVWKACSVLGAVIVCSRP